MDAIVSGLGILLAFIEEILPSLTTSVAVQKLVELLITWIPVIAKAAPQFIQNVERFISILEANPVTMPEQIQQLRAELAASSATFDTTEKQAEANDAAADAQDAVAGGQP